MEIDNEFRNYIRPLSAEEFEKLKTSVLAEGIRDPLVTWQGKIGRASCRERV